MAGPAKRDSVIAALKAAVREPDVGLAAKTGPGLSVMELPSIGVHPPTARMSWGNAKSTGTPFPHGLPTSKADEPTSCVGDGGQENPVRIFSSDSDH